MSNKKSQRKATLSLDGFRGINCEDLHQYPPYASDIVNYRIRKDGALEKRHGFCPLVSLPATPRATYSCTIDGNPNLYLLIGDTVYFYNFNNRELELICKIESNSGVAHFFQYQGSLFLVDGVNLYQYSNNSFSPTVGYVPLIGKDWPSNEVGKINEPRNILNNHGRITYVADKELSFLFSIDDEVESIDAVYLESNLLSSEKYAFDPKSNRILIGSGLSVGARVEIYFTYKSKYDHLYDQLVKVQNTAFFGGYRNRILLSGSNSSIVFCSNNPSPEELGKGAKHYSQTSGIYFPVPYATKVGNGKNNIKSISHYHDKILIFTEGDVWMMSPKSENADGLYVSCVSSETGCLSSSGATALDADAVSISRNGILRWTHSSDAQSNCRAVNISQPIENILKNHDMYMLGAYYDQKRNELWIYKKNLSNVLIYSFETSAWYTYRNIHADTMLTVNGEIAYIDQNVIYIYDPFLPCDIDVNNNVIPITASYTTNITDFGTEEPKNICELILHADLMGDSVSIAVTTNNDANIFFTTKKEDGIKHSVIKKRISSKRFQYATVIISTTGSKDQVIYALKINTR